jgi:hypothetical protein
VRADAVEAELLSERGRGWSICVSASERSEAVQQARNRIKECRRLEI